MRSTPASLIADRSPVRLDQGQDRPTARQAFGRPVLFAVVVPGHRGRPRGDLQPGLFRAGEDVDLRRQPVGLVQRPDPDEAQDRPGPGVMAPQGDQASRAPGYLLALCCVPGAENVAEAQAILRSSGFPVITSVLRNRVLTPGQTLPMLAMPDQDLGELGASVWAELDTARFDVEVEICYCSVFDDCWRTRYPDAVRTPVERCIRREDQE